MSDILGPEAVERVRWRMQRADMYEISLTEVDCLIATIDALAEALDHAGLDFTEPCLDCGGTSAHDEYCRFQKVSTWLSGWPE